MLPLHRDHPHQMLLPKHRMGPNHLLRQSHPTNLALLSVRRRHFRAATLPHFAWRTSSILFSAICCCCCFQQ
jgi:hypothetical protein